MIEVMIAMSIMTIGAMGVMGMIRASVQGNVDARNQDVANQVARTWMERMRRASTGWTTDGNIQSPGGGADKLIAGHIDSGWYVPADDTPGVGLADGTSAAFDLLGRDVPTSEWYTRTDPVTGASTPGAALFCTHVRLDCITGGAPAGQCPLLRTQVRVFWPRRLTAAPAAQYCDTASITDVELNANNEYHFTYVTSAIRRSNIL